MSTHGLVKFLRWSSAQNTAVKIAILIAMIFIVGPFMFVPSIANWWDRKLDEAYE